jgi:hypothetical protein
MPKLDFIPLCRKKAIFLKKMWLISPARKSPLPLSDLLSLINLVARYLCNQRTMPARPARGLFDEHSLLFFYANIFRNFYGLLKLLNLGVASLVLSLHLFIKNSMEVNSRLTTIDYRLYAK